MQAIFTYLLSLNKSINNLNVFIVKLCTSPSTHISVWLRSAANAIKNNPLDYTTLYYYDLYPCIVAGEIIGISKKEIMDNYNSMPIHKRGDIVVDSYDLIDYLNIEDGPIMSKLWKELELNILNLEVSNTKEDLLNLAKKIYTSINLVKEECNETETTG